MKITKTQLRKIIKEETEGYDFDMGSAGTLRLGDIEYIRRTVTALAQRLQDPAHQAALRAFIEALEQAGIPDLGSAFDRRSWPA